MMQARLVDFHCHLDLYDDFESIVRECEQANIYTLAVTTTPRAWPRNRQLTEKLQYVRPALGLHPQLVSGNTKKELELWDTYLADAKYIGEVGLDAGPNYFRFLDEQKLVFKHVLVRCAQEGGKVLSVHALRSIDMVLEMIEAHLPANNGTVVLHWFTGNTVQAHRAITLGCYFSVNAAMLGTEHGKSLIRAIPIDRLLTETDGPFIKNGVKPSRPSDVSYAVGLLGNLHDMPYGQMRSQIASNFKVLLAS